MTKHDMAVITAQTTILIGEMQDFHAYIEKLLGFEVQSYQLRAKAKEHWDEIKEKSRPDYKELAERILGRTVADTELDSKELLAEIKEAVNPELDLLNIDKIP